jgi:hypothetical protein
MVVNPKTKVRLDVVVKAEAREAEVDMELLLEVVKKENTLRGQDRKAELAGRVASIRDGIANALKEKAEAPEREALRTLNRLQEMTGIHFPGGEWGHERNETFLPWVSLESAGETLKAFCSQYTDRLEAVKRLEMRASQAKRDLRRIIDETTRVLDSQED